MKFGFLKGTPENPLHGKCGCHGLCEIRRKQGF